MKPKPEPTIEEYLNALKTLAETHPTITVEVDTPHLFILIGALQLAIRHPGFPEYPHAYIVEFIQELQRAVSDEPILAWVIELGFDPAHDRFPGDKFNH